MYIFTVEEEVFLSDAEVRSLKAGEVEYEKCPNCGSKIYFMRVNNHPATMVGEEYKTLHFCSNNCGEDYLSEADYIRCLKELVRRKRNGRKRYDSKR